MARELALKGTHDWLLSELRREVGAEATPRVLDIGAGEGALSARLRDAGCRVSACDVVPDQWAVSGVDFRPLDASGALPWGDGEFDVALAVEVLEHIDGHDRFFAEVSRVLKPGGTLLFTTPNILSLKSRLRFLFTGFYYSFGPLVPFTRDPVSQHISPFTVNRYAWMMSQHRLGLQRVATDKIQTSSVLLAPMVPFIALARLAQFGGSELARQQNSASALFGRKLLVVARKTA